MLVVFTQVVVLTPTSVTPKTPHRVGRCLRKQGLGGLPAHSGLVPGVQRPARACSTCSAMPASLSRSHSSKS